MTTDNNEVRASENNEKPRDPDRTRDLFGVQLEVIDLISSMVIIFSNSFSFGLVHAI